MSEDRISFCVGIGPPAPQMMAGLFSPANTRAQDEAVAIAIAGPIRLTFEKLTPGQVLEVLHWIGYCDGCGKDLKRPSGRIAPCSCWDD